MRTLSVSVKKEIALRLPVAVIASMAELPNRADFLRKALAAGIAAGLSGHCRGRHKVGACGNTLLHVPAALAEHLHTLGERQAKADFVEQSIALALTKLNETEAAAGEDEQRAVAKFRSLFAAKAPTKAPTKAPVRTGKKKQKKERKERMVPITLLLPPEILEKLAGLPGRAGLMRRALRVGLVAGVVGKRRGRGGAAGFGTTTVVVSRDVREKLKQAPAGLQALAEASLRLALGV